jgi:hypothetical protein
VSAIALNIEQLEAELRDCPRRVELDLSARGAFVVALLVRDAVRRGVLHGADGAMMQATVCAFKPMFEECPHALAALGEGWLGEGGDHEPA